MENKNSISNADSDQDEMGWRMKIQFAMLIVIEMRWAGREKFNL